MIPVLLRYAMRIALLPALSLVVAVPLARAADTAKPTASFTFSPSAPVTGETVVFTSTSTDAEGAIVSQAWDIDNDGNFDDGTGTTATRTFTAEGTYTIRLRVTDDEGDTNRVSEDVTVKNNTAPTPVDNAPPAAPAETSPAAAGPTATTSPLAALVSPRLLAPFPHIRMRGMTTSRGVRVDLLSVRTGGGTRILARCRGTGCPWGRKVQDARYSTSSVRTVKILGFTRRYLRSGAVVEVFVTRQGMVGKYTRFTVRKLKPPVRVDSCTAIGSASARRCPSR